MPFCCYSQIGEWTWISGDDTIQTNGNYGAQGVPSINNTPPSLYEPCEWIDSQGNFWLFGGFHFHFPVGADMNDLWKFNPSTLEWTWVKGSGLPDNLGYYGTQGVSSPLNMPSCKGWGAPTWVDLNDNLWVYGGRIGYDDLWKYNISTNEWTWMKGDTTNSPFYQFITPHYGIFQTPDSANTPGSRMEVTTSWTDGSGNLWLFGGVGFDSSGTIGYNYNDLWKYDILLNQWIWMAGSNIPNDTGHYGIKGVPSPLNCPPARSCFAKWKDNQGNFYLFGGLTVDVNNSCIFKGYNDVWKYEISSNNWVWIGGDSTYNTPGIYSAECISNSTNIPRNSYENRATSFDQSGNVYMFGNAGIGCVNWPPMRNELWHYSTNLNEWTLIQSNTSPYWGIKGQSSPLNSPPRIIGAISWLLNDEFWVFGGTQNGNAESYNSLWRYKIDYSCFPTGIESGTQFPVCSIYPNPVTSNLMIDLVLQKSTTVHYRLNNAIGSIIYIENELDQSGNISKIINLDKLSSGIYFLTIIIDNAVLNEKIIVE